MYLKCHVKLYFFYYVSRIHHCLNLRRCMLDCTVTYTVRSTEYRKEISIFMWIQESKALSTYKPGYEVSVIHYNNPLYTNAVTDISVFEFQIYANE